MQFSLSLAKLSILQVTWYAPYYSRAAEHMKAVNLIKVVNYIKAW